MAVSCYLAMTAAEFRHTVKLPPKLAYMACHFSPYGTGLSNIPDSLPPKSILILNDRTPICGHDPNLITQQLSLAVSDLACEAVLLDFQRPDNPETANLAGALTAELTCPVGVSDLYAAGLSCPVFLPPVPLEQPLDAYLSLWPDREIWLEAALGASRITVTKDGSSFTQLPYSLPPEGCHTDDTLYCQYTIHSSPDRIQFTLYRDTYHLERLLSQAREFGVSKTIGLFQQLKDI